MGCLCRVGRVGFDRFGGWQGGDFGFRMTQQLDQADWQHEVGDQGHETDAKVECGQQTEQQADYEGQQD